MIGIAASAHDALEPYVGGMVADTCVRATALKRGKTSDDLDRTDLPALEDSIRRLLAPVAPRAAIDAMIDDLKRAAA